jgi:hypothetical protein
MDCVHKKGPNRILLAGIGLGFVVLPALVLLLPQGASGTDEMMRTLPAYERFQCVLCHISPTPTALSFQLNAFGNDFRNNGAIWDRTLALMNSDGDRCSNGYEIGDREGDGKFDDGGQPRERSNPGNPADCTAPIGPATWGLIKEIFSAEFDQYLLEEPEYEYFALYFGA